MTKKILLSLIIITLSLQAGEFIKYSNALKISSGYTGLNEYRGVYLGIGYSHQLGKTVIELNTTPKFYFYSPMSYYHIPGEDVYIEDKTFYNVDYYSWYSTSIGIETSILFAPRPPIKVRNGNGSFTFSLWRYGLVLEFGVYGKITHVIDQLSIKRNNSYINNNKIIGILYNPSFGVQISKSINLSLELLYSFNLGGSNINPNFKYGGGIVLTFSDPIKE